MLTPIEQELATYQRALEIAKGQIAGLRQELKAEQATKAELLAALEGLLNVPENSNLDVAVELALETIAKAKGE